jgi:hypothetical protein
LSPNPSMHLSRAPYLSHSPQISCCQFDYPSCVWWLIQIMKLYIMQAFPIPCSLVRHKPRHIPQKSIHKYPQLIFLPRCETQIFTLIWKSKIAVLCTLMCISASAIKCKSNAILGLCPLMEGSVLLRSRAPSSSIRELCPPQFEGSFLLSSRALSSNRGLCPPLFESSVLLNSRALSSDRKSVV